MTSIVTFDPAQLPAFAKRRSGKSAMAKALTGGGESGGKRISIKGGVFRLMSAGKEIANIEDRHLDVVMVNAAAKVNRIFYAAAYDSEVAAAPDCWSADGVTPNEDSGNKQSEDCNSCQKNIAGSGQGNSRACRYQQRLAVVLANDLEGGVLQLTLPATSIFGKEEGDKRPLQAYARWLDAQNIDPPEVVTRLKFDTKSESPKLHFKTMRWLTDDEFEIAERQGQSADAIKAITMTVAKMDNVTAVAPLEGKRPARPKPVEVEEEEAPAPPPKAKATAKTKPVEEDEDEPVVRKEEKKASAVPAKKASLAAMVDDWDDE